MGLWYAERMASAAYKLIPIPPPDPIRDEDIPRHFELIDGELVEKESSGPHGFAQSALLGRLVDPFNRRPGGRAPGGWWFMSETLVAFGQHRLRPDVAGWRRERMPELPDSIVVQVVPDWICEILSPNHGNHDTVTKRRIYHQHRVGHYWIIDPVGQRLEVYRWHSDGYLQLLTAQRGERVRAEPFETLEWPVGVLFGDDPD